MSERANPFGDLGDFAPAPAKPKPDPAVIDQVAQTHGFPSRQPSKVDPEPQAAALGLETARKELPNLRKSTGRSHQLNIKTTYEAKQRMMELAAEKGVPLGAILEQALEALEEFWKK